MTRGVSEEVSAEICAEICAVGTQGLWPVEVFGRMCLESPRLAASLSALGSQAMTGGALVYEAMQRQICKDALAEMEGKR